MPNSGGITSQERLLEATLGLWEQRGHAALSARTLGQAAGLPVSSLYHHFGSLEQLFLIAQEHARARAERWCATHLASFESVSGGLPTVMATLIDDWSTHERRLAFTWRECQVMALRDPRYSSALLAWRSLWSSFWQSVCARCGVPDLSEFATLFFYGESLLHMIQWRRVVDRSCLDELCQGWGSWLSGRLTAEGPWRGFARQEANRSMPELSLRNDTAQRIAAAAGETVEELGMAGLTHRAVAQRAGLTLGIVSYNFRTSAELTRAAFEAIYSKLITARTAEDAVPGLRREAAFEELTSYDLRSPRLTGMDEVLLTVARDPELHPFAPQLRYLRGRGSGVKLQELLGPQRAISPTDAALLSNFSGGQRQAYLGLPEEESRPLRQRTLSALLDVLDPHGGRASPAVI